jgi:hypothetical protein
LKTNISWLFHRTSVMSWSIFSRASPTEACPATEAAPDPDTDESQRICTSANALFGAQPGDFHFGRVEADHWPDGFSACVPNLLTEFVFFFYLVCFCVSYAALANRAFRLRPGLPSTGDPAILQGAANQRLDSWAVSLATDYASDPLGIAYLPLTFPPWTSTLSGCTASDDVPSHTFLTQGHANAGWDGHDFDFESCPNLVPNNDLDFFSSGLGAQFEPNSTHFVDPLLQVDHCPSPLWLATLDFDEISAKGLRCDWPKCSDLGVFDSIEKHKSHIKQHARDVSSSWNPGWKCTWHKCNSKASHRSRNVFEAHLNNIHVNPLVCTVKHCKHKTPFRANHDLQRHIATVHNVDSKYTCPYMSCAGRGFIRKDKWMSHLKEHHDTEPCPYAHCQRRMENIPLHQRSVSKHIGKTHSNFECALKSCKGKISRFAESQLLEHLELHHAMEWALVLKARDLVKADGGRILTSDHLLQVVELRDCKMCTENS